MLSVRELAPPSSSIRQETSIFEAAAAAEKTALAIGVTMTHLARDYQLGRRWSSGRSRREGRRRGGSGVGTVEARTLRGRAGGCRRHMHECVRPTKGGGARSRGRSSDPKQLFAFLAAAADRADPAAAAAATRSHARRSLISTYPRARSFGRPLPKEAFSSRRQRRVPPPGRGRTPRAPLSAVGSPALRRTEPGK